MKSLHTLLTVCAPNYSPSKKIPDDFSISNQSQIRILDPIEERSDNISRRVSEIPDAHGKRYEGIDKIVVDIPASIEETLNDFVKMINEYVNWTQI